MTANDVSGEIASLKWPGAGSRVELPAEALRAVGEEDFTLGVWVALDDAEPAGGDILSAEDDAGRGVSLAIVTRTGATSSLAADRQLVGSVYDSRQATRWIDRGRPGEAMYIHSLAVHRGSLYAGVCQAGSEQLGEVFRYEAMGDTKAGRWISLGRPDGSNDVTALASWNGALWAGTGKYRLAGSALPESTNTERGGRVFRLEEGGTWTQVGELPGADAVGGMVVFRDQLWVSSLYRPAQLYTLDRQGTWAEQALPEAERRVESLAVHEGRLYATSYDNAHVYRLDGSRWEDLGSVGDNTQTYAFAAYRERLYVSSWPSGRVYRLTATDTWEDTGRLGEELEVMGLAVLNGKLWGGTLPLADVYSYREEQPWRREGNVDATPTVKYRRAWTMAVHAGELWVGTLPTGHVWSTDQRQAVTWDEPFPDGWQHVALRRSNGELTLWVGGRPMGRSARADGPPVSLGEVTRLTLGAGDHYGWRGRMRELRLWRGAASDREIADEAAKAPE